MSCSFSSSISEDSKKRREWGWGSLRPKQASLDSDDIKDMSNLVGSLNRKMARLHKRYKRQEAKLKELEAHIVATSRRGRRVSARDFDISPPPATETGYEKIVEEKAAFLKDFLLEKDKDFEVLVQEMVKGYNKAWQNDYVLSCCHDFYRYKNYSLESFNNEKTKQQIQNLLEQIKVRANLF